MLLKFLKSNHPSVIFLIPITAFVLWIPALFFTPDPLQAINDGSNTFVYNWFLDLWSFHPKASVILALVLVILEAYMLIRLNFKYIFIESKTYLPSVLFVLFASIMASYQKLHPLLIANIFILLAIDKAFLFEKSKNDIKRYFESGFFLGLGSLFYPNIYAFIIIIWLTLIILRTFNWREAFSSLLGLITPFVFYLALLFLNNRIDGVFIKLKNIFTSPAESIDLTMYSLIACGYLALIILVALIVGAKVVGVKKISTRKYFTLFFWFMIFIFGLFYFHPSFGYELGVTLAIPLSMVCAIYFTEMRGKWLNEVIFALTLLAVIIIIWFQ